MLVKVWEVYGPNNNLCWALPGNKHKNKGCERHSRGGVMTQVWLGVGMDVLFLLRLWVCIHPERQKHLT